MEITWVGHATFLLRSKAALLMDPFPEALGLHIPPALAQAAVVTVSNADPSHSATDTLPGTPTILTEPGEYDLSGLHLKGLRTRLGPSDGDGDVPVWNTVFLVETEGLSVAHLGGLR